MLKFLIVQYANLLREGGMLPAETKDNLLSGWISRLLRIGTHSKLFNKVEIQRVLGVFQNYNSNINQPKTVYFFKINLLNKLQSDL